MPNEALLKEMLSLLQQYKKEKGDNLTNEAKVDIHEMESLIARLSDPKHYQEEWEIATGQRTPKPAN